MIITSHGAGRSRRDTRDLVAHLALTTDGQSVTVERIVGSVAETPAQTLADMDALRAATTARIAYYHFTLSPRSGVPYEQRAEQCDAAVSLALEALGAQDHLHVVVAHTGKPRARGEGAADYHWHLLVANVGPNGRCLNSSHLFPRLEAARATFEARFGEPLTASRHTDAIATYLEKRGDVELATRVRQDRPAELPSAGLSSVLRGRLARQGLSAPRLRAAVIAAWQGSDSALGFKAALAEAGLRLLLEHDGKWFVYAGEHPIEYLNRFLDLPVEAVAERLNDVPASVSTTSHDGETWVGDITSSTEHKESVHTPLTEPFDAFVLTYAIGRIPSQTSGWNTRGWIPRQTEAASDHTAAKAYWTTLGYIDRERAKVQKALEILRKGPPGPESRGLALRQAGATLTLASAAEVQAESKLIAAKIAQAERERRTPVFKAAAHEVLAWVRRQPTAAQRDKAEIARAEAVLVEAKTLRKNAFEERAKVEAQIEADKKAYADLLVRDAPNRELKERGLLTELYRWNDQRAVLGDDPWLASSGIAAIEAAVAELRRARVDGPRCGKNEPDGVSEDHTHLHTARGEIQDTIGRHFNAPGM